MGQEELKKTIESIIEETFDELKKTYSNCCKNTSKDIKGGVIFPSYSKNNIRVSEQELRCMFIQKLYEKGLCYSIETPTIKKYRFTDTNNDGTKNRDEPKVFEGSDDDDGESAQIDLTIHDKEDINKRLCIIEFKAHGRTSGHDYTKDLLKLYSEPDCELRYFVQIFESFNKRTFDSVNKKLNEASNYIIGDPQNNDKDIFDKVQCRFDILDKKSKYYNDKNLDDTLIGDANNNS